MPIFGYSVVGANSLGLADTDLFGNWDVARVALRGNPVTGGNMVTAHAMLSGVPLGGVPATMQIGVYDATVGAPAVWPLFATSNLFVVPVAAPPVWYVTPIAGALVAGNSYAAAILGNNGHVSNPSVLNDPIPNEYFRQAAIVPGVFPNPLGVGINGTREWSLYITYLLADVSRFTGALSCDCE